MDNDASGVSHRVGEVFDFIQNSIELSTDKRARLKKKKNEELLSPHDSEYDGKR